jgi:hypothetical protein
VEVDGVRGGGGGGGLGLGLKRSISQDESHRS